MAPFLAGLMLALTCLFAFSAPAADTLNWRTNQNRVSADIKAGNLPNVLGRIAAATGWQVFVEPGTTHRVSARFIDLPPGEALRRLVGELNFALVPETNSSPKLFVFRTSMQKATQLVQPAKAGKPTGKAKVIPNELIVRLKPGAKIEDIARQLGAKVVGRIDGLNAYRLEFEDEEAADAAREQLASNSDVASVDNNYSIDRPPEPAQVASGNLPPPPRLQLKPPPDDGRVIVGLIDTAVQSLGSELDQFLLKQVSVAGDGQLDPNSPSHGTSMAGTILSGVAACTGGAASMQILPVDVYGSNPGTSTFDVANGIVQAVNGGAKIINLSLGSEGDSSFLHGVIQDASAQRILFVGAAGNQPVTTPFYPAAYPEVNAVTAVDQGKIAPYANRGSFVSLGAPGTSVVYYRNQPWYAVGTSSAAAYASGIAACAMDRAPCSTTATAQTYLQNNLGIKINPGQ